MTHLVAGVITGERCRESSTESSTQSGEEGSWGKRGEIPCSQSMDITFFYTDARHALELARCICCRG